MENMNNFIDLLVTENAWIFDPHDEERPVGVISKNTSETKYRYPYRITWYFNDEPINSTKCTYEYNRLIELLKPSYDPRCKVRPTQWVPVYPSFVEKHYPKILEAHTARNNIFTLSEQALQKPYIKTIKALYAYLIQKNPSLRNLYKTSDELLDMIIKEYEECFGKNDNP